MWNGMVWPSASISGMSAPCNKTSRCSSGRGADKRSVLCRTSTKCKLLYRSPVADVNYSNLHQIHARWNILGNRYPCDVFGICNKIIRQGKDKNCLAPFKCHVADPNVDTRTLSAVIHNCFRKQVKLRKKKNPASWCGILLEKVTKQVNKRYRKFSTAFPCSHHSVCCPPSVNTFLIFAYI